MNCPSCGARAAPRLTWQRCANGTIHLRADCPAFGGFLRYLPQTAVNVTAS